MLTYLRHFLACLIINNTCGEVSGLYTTECRSDMCTEDDSAARDASS